MATTTHEVEGLKRLLKRKGGRNYYTTPASPDREWLEGLLYSNGTVNNIVLTLLFS